MSVGINADVRRTLKPKIHFLTFRISAAGMDPVSARQNKAQARLVELS